MASALAREDGGGSVADEIVLEGEALPVLGQEQPPVALVKLVAVVLSGQLRTRASCILANPLGIRIVGGNEPQRILEVAHVRAEGDEVHVRPEQLGAHVEEGATREDDGSREEVPSRSKGGRLAVEEDQVLESRLPARRDVLAFFAAVQHDRNRERLLNGALTTLDEAAEARSDVVDRKEQPREQRRAGEPVAGEGDGALLGAPGHSADAPVDEPGITRARMAVGC
mmetsp:Transcript_26589/g.60147  ORF Transcript_26589/g.60147 Transcript_26589/m.60147 type:complete len:226 (+) Transcript_26589:264-941(+)